jgi:uncharacterized protein (DUF4415 family)
MGMRFEWDPAKAASNLRKHRVSFETAVRAFADPFAMTDQDRIEDGELRWRTLGVVDGYVLLLVAHTIRDDDEAGRPVEIIRIIRRDKLIETKDDAMNKKVVRRDVDLANLPALTDTQKVELAALAARPDSEIDYGDIPPLTEAFWDNAVRGRFYKPTKTSTTLRLDTDVLAWLKAEGKGYQSRINAILRREMLASLKR